jgi:urease accessory protein
MRKITTMIGREGPCESADSSISELVLPYDTRKKSRFKAETTSGETLGVMLPRGQVLRGGDVLADADGARVHIVAAMEPVSWVQGGTPQTLARAAYHLGNRHMPLQVGENWLCYQHDHVLDDMVRGLGLQVTTVEAAFEPEEGAYAAHSQAHAHTGAHDHSSDNTHGHSH